MTTISNIDDLLRIVRENDEFRVALRRELLTDDLLGLPREFTEMRKTQNSILDEIADLRRTEARILADQREMRETQTSMLETQNRILADQREMRETQDSMLETQARMLDEISDLRHTQNRILLHLDEIRADTKALHGMYRRQHDDLGRFRGNYAVSAMRDNSGDIARLFSRRLGVRRAILWRLSGNKLMLELRRGNVAAIDTLYLRERAWDTINSPDLVARVSDFYDDADEPLFYVAVEASYTGDLEDLRRATDHAKMLRSGTGLDAYAIVAGVRKGPSIEGLVFDDVEQYVAANNEEAALWYQLEESELEPSDPC